MIFRVLACAAALLGFLAMGFSGVLPKVCAANFYVATDGDDNAAGTIGAPLQSIETAAGKAGPGDTVYIRGGTHYPDDGIWIGNSGTAGAPITLRPYDNEKVIVDGSNFDATIFTVGGDYVVIRDLTIRNAASTGIYTWKGDNNSYIGNTVYNTQRGAISAGGESWADGPRNIRIEDNTVYNFALENSAKTAGSGWASAISCSLSTGCAIRNNTVYNGYGEGINCPLADDCLVENNTVYDVYSVCYYLDNAQSCVIRRNLAYSTGNSEYYRNGKAATGLQIANEDSWFDADQANPCRNNVIENNLIISCGRGFIYGDYEAGGGLIDHTVVNNTFYGSRLYTIHIDPDNHSGSVFANNIFYHTSGDYTMWGWDDPGALDGITFANNSWYGGGAGDAAGSGDVTANPKLVNPGSYDPEDYLPQIGSPLIDAADGQYAPSKDYRGFLRGQAPDMGAMEQGASIPVLSTAAAAALALLLAGGVARLRR